MNPCNIITYNKHSHTLESPTIILKKRNFDVIGEITDYTNWTISLVANGIDEISFDVYKFHNDVKCPIWDKLIDLALIEVQGYGHFEIKVDLADLNETIKSITAQSLEVELGQLTLNEFHVNDEDATTMEETEYNKEDFDKYGEFIPTVFCNFFDTKHSLLHRVLADKAPHWSIGHVPNYIAINKTDQPEVTSAFQRTYTVDGTSIYDFLTGDVAKESNVVFLFDTYERKIHCYNLEDYIWKNEETNETILIDAIGEDTTVFIDKDNLAKEITLSGDKDSVKNCFRVTGGDDIITDRIRAVNMNGSNYIYMFSNFQTEDMPKELVQKLEQYQLDLKANEPLYYGNNGIFTRLCAAYDKYYYLESKMMPQVEITETTAQEQYQKIIDGLSSLSVGVFSLSSYDSSLFTGITNNVEAMANIFIDSRYSLEIVENSVSYNSQSKIWSGRIKVHRSIDETDRYITPENTYIRVNINADEVEYTRQKVLKALCKTSMLDIDFDVDDMTDKKIREYFSLYCRVRLQSFYDGYDTCISILAKLTQTTLNTDKSIVAGELYSKYNNLKNIVNSVLQERTSQVTQQETLINEIVQEQSEFQEKWNFKNYLGDNLYHVFCMYRRDDDYQNDNYISDGLEDNDAELTKKAKELLDFAKSEIEKSCKLQRTISTNLNNLLLLSEFEPIHEKFALFNYIRVGVDDELFKLRLLSLSYDSSTPETINVTYGENIESIGGSTSDAKSIFDQVSSISSSFSSTVLQAKSGSQANNEIVNMRNNGLNAALTRIKTSDNNEVTIGSQGILCKGVTDVGYYSDKQTRIVDTGFYITTDNWQTIRACIGETTDGNFGVIADTLCGKVTFSEKIVAGDVNGIVTIDGNGVTLKGGSIKWETPIDFDAVSELKDFKDSVEGTLGLGTTITKDSIISPKIGGGYLYIKDIRPTDNTKVSVEINPSGMAIPSDLGNKDDIYIFNIKKDGDLIMGVDSNGNGFFKGKINAAQGYFAGEINASNGKIGGFTIGQNYIGNNTSSLSGNTNSVYVGTDGISCGNDFQVTSSGQLIASNARISGRIEAESLKVLHEIRLISTFPIGNSSNGQLALQGWIGNSLRNPGLGNATDLHLGDGYTYCSSNEFMSPFITTGVASSGLIIDIASSFTYDPTRVILSGANAYIGGELFTSKLKESHHSSGSYSNLNTVDLTIRASGPFVVAYGTCKLWSLNAGETDEFLIPPYSNVTPKHVKATGISYYGKRAMVVALTTDGKFLIRNASEMDISTSDTQAEFNFRIDYTTI